MSSTIKHCQKLCNSIGWHFLIFSIKASKVQILPLSTIKLSKWKIKNPSLCIKWVSPNVLASKILSLQEKCLLATKNFWRTQKALSKNPISDGKIKPSQILGKMWNICDQQKMLSELYVVAVTNANILEGNFPSILFSRDN